MELITTFRETNVDLPWSSCGRLLAGLLTSEDSMCDRAHLVGRTHLRFVIAVQRVEAAHESMRFCLIADSPDLHRPIRGFVEVRPRSSTSTALTVSLVANLDDEARRHHLGVREAIASLADVLTTTIATAVGA
jgi:hypothetical protein